MTLVYTLDYAIDSLKKHQIVKCPFGQLDQRAISYLKDKGYSAFILRSKDYRGTIYRFIEPGVIN